MNTNRPHYRPPDRFPTDSLIDTRPASDQAPLLATAEFTPQATRKVLNRLPATTPQERPVTTFVRLPANPVHVDQALARRPWRIKLSSLQNLPEPPGLIIHGDVFIGRVAGGIQPDLDLTNYAGAALGVSRLHALLRPTPSQLLIHDLGSTNGTYVSAKPVTAGSAAAVSNGDILAFGALQFTVRIIEQP